MIDLLLSLLSICVATVIIVGCAVDKSKKLVPKLTSSSGSDEVDWTAYKKVDSCAGCKKKFDDGPVVACHQKIFHFTCPCNCINYKRLKNAHGSDIAMFNRKAPDTDRFRSLNMKDETDRKIYDHVLKAYNDSVESKRKLESSVSSNSARRREADGVRKTPVAVGV